MRRDYAVYMTLLVALVDCMLGCVSPKFLQEASMPRKVSESVAKDPPKIDKLTTVIPLKFSDGDGEVYADVYRPFKKTVPKTLVIIVPGSGNISREGEVSGDGVKTYASTIKMSEEWAKALATYGYFTLTYDKRSCTSASTSICHDNDQTELEQLGIIGLANDLDQVYRFAISKFSDDLKEARIVFLSFTQGAQVISLSTSMSKISGVVVLSPLMDDLESMWTTGLENAALSTTNASVKHQLLNRKETMAAFFNSLKRGEFPDEAHVHGASVKFWLSWIAASKQTLDRFKSLDRESLLLISKADHFTSETSLKKLVDQAKNTRNLKVKTYTGIDRNFVTDKGVPSPALSDVTAFIDGLKAVSLENR